MLIKIRLHKYHFTIHKEQEKRNLQVVLIKPWKFYLLRNRKISSGLQQSNEQLKINYMKL